MKNSEEKVDAFSELKKKWFSESVEHADVIKLPEGLKNVPFILESL